MQQATAVVASLMRHFRNRSSRVQRRELQSCLGHDAGSVINSDSPLTTPKLSMLVAAHCPDVPLRVQRHQVVPTKAELGPSSAC